MWEKVVSILGGNLLGSVKDLVKEFHMSPEDKAKLELALLDREAAIRTAFMSADKDQVELNKIEAASSSVLVAGWRPALGWVCVFSLAYVWIVRDWLAWIIAATGSSLPAPPMVMQDAILELTLGMLGMASLRSWEKYKGVAK
jgi:hypothetical protein